MESFMILAKSAKGLALQKLIEDFIDHPSIFNNFNQLLALLTDKHKGDEQYSKHFSMLKLFAYGTFSDYKANPNEFPQLSENKIHKLKLLTIVSLSKSHRILGYSLLESELDLHTIRDIEDLIIEAIYADLVLGKLDHHGKKFLVFEDCARDVEIGAEDAILKVLEQWMKNSDEVLTVIDNQINTIFESASVLKQEKEEYNKKLQKSIGEAKKQKSKSNSHHMMDLDYDAGGIDFMRHDGDDDRSPTGRTSRRKQGGFGLGNIAGRFKR